MPAAFAKSGRVHGERDSTLVTSASLRNLQAVITTHDAGVCAGRLQPRSTLCTLHSSSSWVVYLCSLIAKEPTLNICSNVLPHEFPRPRPVCCWWCETSQQSVMPSPRPPLDRSVTAGEATVPNVGANGMSLSSQVRGAAATGARDSHSPSGAVSVSGGTVLLTTGVSQPTVNPTWPVSETASSSAWLQEDANVGDLDSARREFLFLQTASLHVVRNTTSASVHV